MKMPNGVTFLFFSGLWLHAKKAWADLLLPTMSLFCLGRFVEGLWVLWQAPLRVPPLGWAIGYSKDAPPVSGIEQDSFCAFGMC